MRSGEWYWATYPIDNLKNQSLRTGPYQQRDDAIQAAQQELSRQLLLPFVDEGETFFVGQVSGRKVDLIESHTRL
jgi:hypothetical protein